MTTRFLRIYLSPTSRKAVARDAIPCKILKVQQANADGIKMLKEAGADEAVLKIKSLEAFEKAADGKATKILLPPPLSGPAALKNRVLLSPYFFSSPSFAILQAPAKISAACG